jgi:hypothetical protein
MTLNQIIAKFRTQAESHKMVGKFEVGQDFDFSVEEVKYYPLVWLIPNGFQFDSENKLVTYLFTLIIADRQFESGSNTNEVLSDTAGILLDLVTLLKRNYINDEDFQIIANSTAEPFADSNADVIAGYAIDLQVNTPYLESYCDIPT